MNKVFLDSIKKRRSIYSLDNTPTLSFDEIMEIITESVKYAPTAFNSQSARLVVLFGLEHEKFWDITTETLRQIVPAEAFGSTEQKMKSFKAGQGTILYFEDQTVIDKLQKDFPLYKDNFPVWSEQSSGILQFIIWCALSDNEIGASLQHYNPLVDEKVKRIWNISPSWKLIAQMPFGRKTVEAGEKAFMPLEDRIIVYK